MMFKYSFENEMISNLINKSVNIVLDKGYRTNDIFSEGSSLLSTSEMGDAVLEELKNENI